MERYLCDHARLHKKPSSVANDERLITKRILPVLGRVKVIDLSRSDIAALHKSLSETPYEANRTLALVSKAMNLAEIWDLRPEGTNPCRLVPKYKERKRERFLSEVELARLGDALKQVKSKTKRAGRSL